MRRNDARRHSRRTEVAAEAMLSSSKARRRSNRQILGHCKIILLQIALALDGDAHADSKQRLCVDTKIAAESCSYN